MGSCAECRRAVILVGMPPPEATGTSGGLPGPALASARPLRWPPYAPLFDVPRAVTVENHEPWFSIMSTRTGGAPSASSRAESIREERAKRVGVLRHRDGRLPGRPPDGRPSIRFDTRSPGDRPRMLTRALARFVCLIAALASTAGAAQAQPRTVIAVDPADKAAAFGADDLSQAIARWRVPVTVVAPAQLARRIRARTSSSSRRRRAKLAGQPAVTGLTAQGYAIRRVTAGGTTRWWAIGHDSAGAMYAALELAEAVRIDGHLGNVDRAAGQPGHRQARHQVQHPARRAHAELLGRLDLRPGQHPRHVGHGVLDAGSSTRWRGTATTCCRCGA